jgi:hypothetical protein
VVNYLQNTETWLNMAIDQAEAQLALLESDYELALTEARTALAAAQAHVDAHRARYAEMVREFQAFKASRPNCELQPDRDVMDMDDQVTHQGARVAFAQLTCSEKQTAFDKLLPKRFQWLIDLVTMLACAKENLDGIPR